MLRSTTSAAPRCSSSSSNASRSSRSVRSCAFAAHHQQQHPAAVATSSSSGTCASSAAAPSSVVSSVSAAAAAAASLVVAAAVVIAPGPAFADEEQLPGPLFPGYNDPQKAKLKAAEENFQQSDTLKKLLEKSSANKAANKRAIQNKYCARQAELGIGDCGGLRFIPGMTKNGKQPTPEIVQKMLGVEIPKMEGEGKTLADLLGPEATQE